MKVQKHIEVRLLKKRLIPVVDVVQYDTGVQLVFSLVDFDIPSGTSATLYVQKRSGKFVYQEKDITISGNEITIDLENQALTEHGETKYQITLKNGTDTVTTFAGVLRVEKSIADANAVESKTVIRAFDEAVAEHVAEFQTKAEQIVAACIATIPEDYTVMEAKVNELANAVKGNLSGAVVFADDVSSVEHRPIVKVRGANLISFPYYNESGVKNGITYTVNDDGSVTAKGTATANAAFYLTYGLSGIKGTVFLSGCPDGGSITASSGGGYSLRMNKIENGIEVTGGTDVGNGKKITLNGESVKVYIVVLAGKTVDCTFYPMLNYGESAKSFVKSDLTTVTVKRCGKNLIDVSDVTVESSNAWSNKHLGSFELPSGKYTVSLDYNQFGDVTHVSLSARKYGVAEKVYADVSNNVQIGKMTMTFEIPAGESGVMLYVYSNCTANVRNTKCLFKNIQVEVGDIATEFEAYKEATEYIPSSDGTVSGLTSVSPNMTILTDTEGAIVECEYNRDTNKVIEKLINAINNSDGMGAVNDEQVAKAVFDYLTEHPVSAGSTATIGTVNLLAEKWVGTGNLYSQVVTIAGVTKNSQVDLTPSVEQLVVFHEKDLTFVTENEGGTVTVYAIGQKPTNDYTIQVTITEVAV